MAWHGLARHGRAWNIKNRMERRMSQLHFILKGTLPLLQHNIRSMEYGTDKIPEPEEAARRAAYFLPDGSLCMPASAVRNAMLRAAIGRKAQEERTKRKVVLMPLISGAVLFADDFFPLVDEQGNAVREYIIDIRSVNIKGRGRVPRARPRIDPPWYLVCTFNYNPDIVSLDLVRELLATAGQTIGIGDFRLEKKGPFGGFELAEIAVK